MVKARRFILILLEIIASFVVVSIVTPLVLMLMLHVGSVQQYVVHQFSSYASSYLGVTVSIESVYLQLFKRAVVNGFYVEDPYAANDTLLYIDRVDAIFDRYDFKNRKLYFSSADVDGGGLFLATDADSVVNIKRLADIMRPEVMPEEKFKMAITDIEVDEFEFRFKRYDQPPIKNPDAINYFDMAFQKMSASVTNFELIQDSVMMRVDSLTFVEKSGLTLNSLNCEQLTVAPYFLGVEKGDVSLDKSTFFVSNYSMYYYEWNMRDYIHDVKMKAHIAKSSVNFSTIEKLSMLKPQRNFVFNFIGGFTGTVDDFTVDLLLAQFNNSTLSSSTVSMQGLPDFENTTFTGEFGYLQTNSSDISILSSQFAGSYIAPIPMLTRAAPLTLRGSCSGMADSIDLECNLTTFLGDISVSGITKIDGTAVDVDADISTDRYNLGVLLDNPKLGSLSLHSNVKTSINGGDITAQVTAALPNISLNGYNYQGIDISAQLQDSVVGFALNGVDPNLVFVSEGYCNFADSLPDYALDLNLSKANLFELNINKRDTVSQISTQLHVQGQGFGIDDINGLAQFSNVVYNTAKDTIATDDVSVEVQNFVGDRRVEVQTEFGYARLLANKPFEQLLPFVIYNVSTFVPYLFTNNVAIDSTTMAVVNSAYDNNDTDSHSSDYSFELSVESENALPSILVPGLTLAQGSVVNVDFSPTNNRFLVSASSDYIRINDTFNLESLALDAYNSSDTLYFSYIGDEVIVSDVYMPNLSFVGMSQGGNVTGRFSFENGHDGSSASLEAEAEISKSAVKGLDVTANIKPSHLTMSGITFNLLPSTIIFDSEKTRIDNFTIESQGHKLIVDGVLSKESSDTLHLSLDGVGLGRLSLFTEVLGYSVDGVVNGDAYYISQVGKDRIYTDITIDSLMINEYHIPSLQIKSRGVEPATDFMLYDIFADGKTIVDGAFDLNSLQYRAHVAIDSLQLKAIDPLMTSFGHNTHGFASLNVELDNKTRPLNINGSVDIHDFSTTINFTNVDYSAKGHVEIYDNFYTLQNGVIADPLGSVAPLFATLDCGERYKMVDYSFYGKPSEFLCLNTSIEDNPQFYGSVFATGEVSVTGKGTNVVMDVSATAVNESSFFVPLSEKSTINEADFITFTQRQVETQEDEREFISFAKIGRLNQQSNFRLNLSAVVDRDTEVQLVMDPTVGDIIKTRGEGQFNVAINPTQNIFELEGAYNISTGGYLFTLPNFELVNKYFDIKTGSSIDWSGNPLGANLNITATYRTKTPLSPLLGSSSQYNRRVDVDCDLSLTGMLLQPDIQLGISLPGADPETESLVQSALNTEEAVSRQIFWLLFTNSFYAEATESGTTNVTVGTMSSAGAVTGLEFLSNQISNWISSDKFNLGINYRPKSELSSDEVELNISAPLLNNRLILEAEGNYDFHNNTSAYISENDNALSGNFYVTYIIDQKGNLRTKAFSRQITTFDENQGLQENGVGIYYKEDFDDFKDLVSIHSKERNDRESLREARRKERKDKLDARDKAHSQSEENADLEENSDLVEDTDASNDAKVEE